MTGKKLKDKKSSKDSVEISVSNPSGHPTPSMNSLDVSFSSLRPQGLPNSKGISKITVSSYKSINHEALEIRPLTILAGANSSGKSSFLQPLLLMKQTLEASFDPGALLLNGSNANFSDASQLLSRNTITKSFEVKFEETSGESFAFEFKANASRGFDISSQIYSGKSGEISVYPGMTQEQILNSIPSLKQLLERTAKTQDVSGQTNLSVAANRCFLEVIARIELDGKAKTKVPNLFPILQQLASLADPLKHEILRTIHLPGLRGNPRTYQMTHAPSLYFPGTFEIYTASIILWWAQQNMQEQINAVAHDLEALGVAWKITATMVEGTQIELKVPRVQTRSKKNEADLVNIADVGIGVSQILPVVVALHAAQKHQLVYIEQPEIHLHPRAQSAMAGILVDAAKRGVRVVIETHSSLLLLGIQTLVAEGKLSPDLVKLHWFSRDENGVTSVRSDELDEVGAFGDWPVDFAETSLKAQSRYLDAAEAKLMGNGNGIR
jgi:predicted ATPase